MTGTSVLQVLELGSTNPSMGLEEDARLRMRTQLADTLISASETLSGGFGVPAQNPDLWVLRGKRCPLL